GMGIIPVLSRDDFNCGLIVITASCITAAILALVWLLVFDQIRDKCRKKNSKGKDNSSTTIPPVSVTVSTTDKNQVSVKIGDEMEYIDDRNTNVVSSTVQISSIHDSPPPANL
ncbi:hypothetical protein PFISCL1PPCAC_339, partial [Pristionchus fissidentatus]